MILWDLSLQNHYSKIIFICQKSFLFIDFFIEMSAEMPVEMPGPMPVEMPGPMPTWMSVEMPAQMPAQISVEMPAQMPAQMPTQIRARTPYIRKNLNPYWQRRRPINEAERKALQQQHHDHSHLDQKQLRAWFLEAYQWSISQSIISESLSSWYEHLDSKSLW